MKVSIITVTYNSYKTLPRAIESVLRQTYQDIDYWIIDGNSTDGTQDIIKSYTEAFNGKLHWLSEQDKGIYDAMNKGFAHCDGDVLGFLNSDDWFTTASAVETIVNAFSKDYDAVYGDIHIVGKDSPEKQIYYQSGRMFRPFLLRFGFAPAHPTFYVRRSLLQSYGAYNDNYKIAGDFDLIARFCHKYKIKTKYLHTDLVTMAIGGVSTKDEEAYAEGLNEILYSCKSLGIRTSKTMLSLKKYFLMLANII